MASIGQSITGPRFVEVDEVLPHLSGACALLSDLSTTVV
jgi:hypothetical protein